MQRKLTLFKLDPGHYCVISVFYFEVEKLMWASVGKGDYCCPTRQWDREVGPRREMCVSWVQPNGHQREGISRVKAVNMAVKGRKVMSTGRRSGKSSIKRAKFGAGEEGSEVASLESKCQGSLDVAICLQATHVAQKLLSVDHSVNNSLLIAFKEIDCLSWYEHYFINMNF